MKLLCAWCVREGKPAAMAETEPLEDERETHGICPEHRLELEAGVARYRWEAEHQREEASYATRPSAIARRPKLCEKVDP